MSEAALERFGSDYAEHRREEGRAYRGADLLALPYLGSGLHARQWAVRARSFDALVRHLVWPERKRLGRPLTVLDLGAGNGWLSYRLALEGNRAIAVDVRDDMVDGLGAAETFIRRVPGNIECIKASFDSLPVQPESMDVAIFNASLHYSTDLARTLREAARVIRPGGKVAVVDSAFYRREADGHAMVAEKRDQAAQRFGERADALMGLPFIEFLTCERLDAASAGLGLRWRRRRVLYPLWYEVRPLWAALLRRRRPSRFDLWIGERR